MKTASARVLMVGRLTALGFSDECMGGNLRAWVARPHAWPTIYEPFEIVVTSSRDQTRTPTTARELVLLTIHSSQHSEALFLFAAPLDVIVTGLERGRTF